MRHSRRDVSDTLTRVILSACAPDWAAPGRLVMEHVLLVSVLHRTVGVEVGQARLGPGGRRPCRRRPSESHSRERPRSPGGHVHVPGDRLTSAWTGGGDRGQTLAPCPPGLGTPQCRSPQRSVVGARTPPPGGFSSDGTWCSRSASSDPWPPAACPVLPGPGGLRPLVRVSLSPLLKAGRTPV